MAGQRGERQLPFLSRVWHLNYQRAAWLVVGLWFSFCLATLNYNGPFYDESIYITAGLRTFQGHGYSDGYLTWFAGSLLWPVLAGAGYQVAGLIGTRLVALLLTTVAFVAVVQAAKNLFGAAAGFWTAVTFALNAALASLARLGVYDIPALAGIAISLWAVTELERRDHRLWLGLAAVAFTIGTFSKYPMGLMLLPLCAVLYCLRGSRAVTDITIFILITAGIALAFFLPAREQLAALVDFQIANKPTFGVSTPMIAAAIYYISAAPLALAIAGWFLAHDRRQLATVLLLGLGIWPAYHLLAANPASLNKHLVFGFLFAHPLIGVGLATLSRNTKGQVGAMIIVVLLTGLGWLQLGQFDDAWPDVRQAVTFLERQVQPGQKLLINESWPYTMYLYTDGRIESPWDVFDVYRITQGESTIGLCEYDWFVDSRGSYPWTESLLDTINQCGTFRQVYSTTSTVTGLGTGLYYVTYSVQTFIWQNVGRTQPVTEAQP
jgi:4-amino-4-deoxy-L-arabinose transferase-like glycosyltransferase